MIKKNKFIKCFFALISLIFVATTIVSAFSIFINPLSNKSVIRGDTTNGMIDFMVDKGELGIISLNYNKKDCNETNRYCSGADINRDGVTDFTDLHLLSKNYNRNDCTANNSFCENLDINKDGSINNGDLSLLEDAFNKASCALSDKIVERADINKDGNVSFPDLLILSQNYGREDCDESNDYCNGADIDMDGSVDTNDLKILSNNYKKSDCKFSREIMERADINKDGNVSFPDLLILSQNYGREDCDESNDYCNGADIDMDGSVNIIDTDILSISYNRNIRDEIQNYAVFSLLINGSKNYSCSFDMRGNNLSKCGVAINLINKTVESGNSTNENGEYDYLVEKTSFNLSVNTSYLEVGDYNVSMEAFIQILNKTFYSNIVELSVTGYNNNYSENNGDDNIPSVRGSGGGSSSGRIIYVNQTDDTEDFIPLSTTSSEPLVLNQTKNEEDKISSPSITGAVIGAIRNKISWLLISIILLIIIILAVTLNIRNR